MRFDPFSLNLTNCRILDGIDIVKLTFDTVPFLFLEAIFQ